MKSIVTLILDMKKTYLRKVLMNGIFGRKCGALLVMVLAGFVACTKYEAFPLRPVSFEIEGKKYYSAKDVNTVYGNPFGIPEPCVLKIREYGDSLDISYSRRTDFINYDMIELSLRFHGLASSFETGTAIEFTEDDKLKEYPFVYFNPVRSSSVSDYDLYRAYRGWIEFYEINWDKMVVSGQFGFSAALEYEKDCTHADVIEVTNGEFRNIPFDMIKEEQTPEL